MDYRMAEAIRQERHLSKVKPSGAARDKAKRRWFSILVGLVRRPSVRIGGEVSADSLADQPSKA